MILQVLIGMRKAEEYFLMSSIFKMYSEVWRDLSVVTAITKSFSKFRNELYIFTKVGICEWSNILKIFIIYTNLQHIDYKYNCYYWID